MDAVTFPNGPISMAGNLFTPADFDPSKKYAALVTVHPGGGVKEQTAGLYAGKFADEGFVTLAFDASFQGESGGEPHHLEDPYARVEDVRAAVDYLQSLDYVDSDRIGVVGICAGGGYAVNAAMTDHRVNAVATVSALNIGTAWRQGWYGLDHDSAAVPMLDQVAQQRTAEAEGGDVVTAPYVPAEPDGDTPYDLAQASEYYLTSRAQHPNAQNKYLLSASIPRIMGFDAFNLVEELFTKPVIMVAGSEAGSLWHSTELHAKLNSTKKLVVVDGGTHMDFYDVEKYVDRAVSEIKPFLDEHLAAK
ncbi:alpha/beta hydrolase [Gordonia sp. NPDC003424]